MPGRGAASLQVQEEACRPDQVEAPQRAQVVECPPAPEEECRLDPAEDYQQAPEGVCRQAQGEVFLRGPEVVFPLGLAAACQRAQAEGCRPDRPLISAISRLGRCSSTSWRSEVWVNTPRQSRLIWSEFTDHLGEESIARDNRRSFESSGQRDAV
jgi:hypothetical protein